LGKRGIKISRQENFWLDLSNYLNYRWFSIKTNDRKNFSFPFIWLYSLNAFARYLISPIKTELFLVKIDDQLYFATNCYLIEFNFLTLCFIITPKINLFSILKYCNAKGSLFGIINIGPFVLLRNVRKCESKPYAWLYIHFLNSKAIFWVINVKIIL
jgi:hypothetical protein